MQMVEALKGVEPSFIRDSNGPWLSFDEYRGLLLDSVFLPCPMGNVVAETWRLYEGLKLGASRSSKSAGASIIIAVSFSGADPFLRVGSWGEAGRLMRDLAASPDEFAAVAANHRQVVV